jgi:hypothetical protein
MRKYFKVGAIAALFVAFAFFDRGFVQGTKTTNSDGSSNARANEGGAKGRGMESGMDKDSSNSEQSLSPGITIGPRINTGGAAVRNGSGNLPILTPAEPRSTAAAGQSEYPT